MSINTATFVVDSDYKPELYGEDPYSFVEVFVSARDEAGDYETVEIAHLLCSRQAQRTDEPEFAAVSYRDPGSERPGGWELVAPTLTARLHAERVSCLICGQGNVHLWRADQAIREAAEHLRLAVEALGRKET